MIRRAFRIAALAAAVTAAALPAFASETVLVPVRTIYPGETVTISALREVVLKPGKQIPADVAFRADDLDGKVARRTLLPNRYVPVNSLREAHLVEQGSPVQVLFEAGPLQISATVICLQSGAVGDVVKVRNMDSGKVFTAIVTGSGTVRVGA
ncbi:flagellar basal body P-ring formation chaperone FlgA [Arvimicrobium flavum]|uniref:flagellar basal body P-ring formation chaperone FlgA n=1 Tax=Arvimicrobium flavum TaxID=3393320 RepID=UPI00237A0D9D|nr:flagellar basal body P-ring formation chaperone FlgA [Mesorhizobium shangrilense]